MSRSNDQEKADRPNLRIAAANNRPRQIILAACVLAAVYMYPTILRPLFGINTSSLDKADTEEKMKEINKVLAEHRPANMPDWSSPFSPKKAD